MPLSAYMHNKKAKNWVPPPRIEPALLSLLITRVFVRSRHSKVTKEQGRKEKGESYLLIVEPEAIANLQSRNCWEKFPGSSIYSSDKV
jgi:hypothetical protein